MDIALAYRYMHEPQTLAFWFRIMDVQSQNKLDRFTLRYLFAAIIEKIDEAGIDIHVDSEHVVVILFIIIN